MRWDYLLVGAGLFNAVLCERLTGAGLRCMVIDRRSHVGGNVYTETAEGITIHRYGAHIFHTGSEEVWRYVSQFAHFAPYIHQPLANWHGALYPLPFNMNTFRRLWGDVTPEQAKAIIQGQIDQSGIREPRNLEEQAILLVGTDIYEKLVRGYTEKQWGRPCRELPPFIIRRLPVRYTFDNNYFSDPYQGIPEGGYTPIIEKMLAKAKVLLNTEYEPFIARTGDTFDRTVYTGEIDRLFHFCYGDLQYRSLRFENQTLDTARFQASAVVNYTDAKTPYTRIIEHKQFLSESAPRTMITYEYPEVYARGKTAYYPVNDEKNDALYAKYRALAKTRKDLILGGRLGAYKYLDMDRVIGDALKTAEALIVHP